MRDAVTIEDVARAGIPRLVVVCAPCRRRGAYSVARLARERPGLRMTDFLLELTAGCEHRSGVGIYAQCQAVYGPGSLPGL